MCLSLNLVPFINPHAVERERGTGLQMVSSLRACGRLPHATHTCLRPTSSPFLAATLSHSQALSHLLYCSVHLSARSHHSPDPLPHNSQKNGCIRSGMRLRCLSASSSFLPSRLASCDAEGGGRVSTAQTDARQWGRAGCPTNADSISEINFQSGN